MRMHRLLGTSSAPWWLLGVMALWAGGCTSGPYAASGTALGTLGGTAVGAMIGHQVGKTGQGALIGGAVGALTGGAIGSALDEIDARNRAEIQARLGQRAPQGAVSVEDIIAMSQAGVPESVIVSHIEIHGLVRPLTPADLIRLQKQGVSEAVMNAAQKATGPRTSRASSLPPRPGPVIVEEHYVVPGCPAYPPPVYYYRPRVHFGIGVGFP